MVSQFARVSSAGHARSPLRGLSYNALTTLPDGLFQDLSELSSL